MTARLDDMYLNISSRKDRPTMALKDLMLPDGASIFYDPGFRVVLEDHMSYLRTNDQTNVLNVSVGDAHRYESDFYGYLRNNGVPANLFWVCLRMNKMSDPNEFGDKFQIVLVPDINVVERIRQSHMTTRKVS